MQSRVLSATPPRVGSVGLPRILCVDDEPNVLTGLQRQLRGRFEVLVATSGREGLALLDRAGGLAVVVSDMRMPEMDGAKFLRLVRERAADTVRILLTGYGDLESMAAAVNDGNIFRLLTKPCATETLLAAIEAAVVRHTRLTAARDERVRLLLEIQSADQVKDEFLASISHELRTPLNVIVGYADLLQERGAGPLTAQQSDILARLAGWAVDLDQLLGQVLFTTAMAAGRNGARPCRVPLATLVTALAGVCTGLARPTSLMLDWQPPHDAAGSVVVELAGILTVVRQLLTNAYASTLEGRVTVRITTGLTDVTVDVAVAGTTVGGLELSETFEARRIVACGKTREALGVGLCLLSRCVARLGGVVEVGQDALFRIRLGGLRACRRRTGASGP